MKDNKLYFRHNHDEEHCYPLGNILHEAWDEGLGKVEVYEALPDNNNLTYIYCTYWGECSGRSECNKANCSYYESRGGWQPKVCKHKGQLYTKGKKITVKTKHYEKTT